MREAGTERATAPAAGKGGPAAAGRVTVVAEAGVNHNGSPDLALRLVDAAAEAGADAVKFQTFKAERVATSAAPLAGYQKADAGAGPGRGAPQGGQSQLDLIRALELDEEAHRALLARCRDRGVAFLSTPFDEQSLDFLVDGLGLDTVKIASGEVTNGPLLLRAGRKAKRVILSTGMSTMAEVEAALGVLAFAMTGAEAPSAGAFTCALESDAGRAALRARLTLLHCTTAYPAPPESINLRAMDAMRARFGVAVGLSDHSAGIAVAVAAAARGATMVEKHLTLDRGLPGPDHAASLEPHELSQMVAAIRAVERALGDGRKEPDPAERDSLAVVRRSLVAARPIRAGEPFTAENVAAKRPGTGLSPMAYWDLLGRPAPRAFDEDEPLCP